MEQNKKCKHCGKEYSKKEINRIYGKDSMVSLLNVCSSQCYTNSRLEAEHPTNSVLDTAMLWWNSNTDKEKLELSLKHYNILDLNTEQIIFVWRRLTGGEWLQNNYQQTNSVPNYVGVRFTLKNEQIVFTIIKQDSNGLHTNMCGVISIKYFEENIAYGTWVIVPEEPLPVHKCIEVDESSDISPIEEETIESLLKQHSELEDKIRSIDEMALVRKALDELNVPYTEDELKPKSYSQSEVDSMLDRQACLTTQQVLAKSYSEEEVFKLMWDIRKFYYENKNTPFRHIREPFKIAAKELIDNHKLNN
jgi:hypothetical protein